MDDNPYKSPNSASAPPPRQPSSVNSPYMPCPGCGASDSSRVIFTWWGSLIGPALLTHVECPHCRTDYNGKTGESNTTKIVIYSLVALAIVLVLRAIVISV